MQIAERDGVVIIGLLLGFEDGIPIVIFASNPKDHAIRARSVVRLSSADVGCEVALLFEDASYDKPLIVGRLVKPARSEAIPSRGKVTISHDGEDPICIESRHHIELRCGKASIRLEADGTVSIRGTQILSSSRARKPSPGGDCVAELASHFSLRPAKLETTDWLPNRCTQVP